MERIQRALELARADRARGQAAASSAPLPREVPAPAPIQPGELRRCKLDPQRLERHHVLLPQEQSPAAAAYRMLRTQLLQRIRGTRDRVIAVASAAGGEGKTLTATNLALSLAADPNHGVFLLDLDLHDPGVADLLGIDSKHGLEQWFRGEATVDEICVGIEGMERLFVLPAMASLPNASDLLAGPRAAELIGELRGRHSDRILIIDVPPALLANDLLALAPLLDGVLLVATEGRTRREDLTRLGELLAPVRILGTVLNRASQSERRAY